MRSRNSRAGLAVPMSKPRYTSAESTLTISTGALLASRRAQSVLPAPVGPARTNTGSSLRRAPRHPAAPQEQPIELRNGEAHPGGPSVVALAGALGRLHLSQQRIHLGQ